MNMRSFLAPLSFLFFLNGCGLILDMPEGTQSDLPADASSDRAQHSVAADSGQGDHPLECQRCPPISMDPGPQAA
jgi:hypothetical protein